MRVDKFLKVSRLLKRRSVAKSAADSGRVLINGREVKPGHKLKIGDAVTIVFGDGELKFRVLLLNERAQKADAAEMYEIIDEGVM
ncbi:MAG: RNA-binding S4 domain-containing protein [Firmicutes bacterium]|nr:RNA-binding S4 domain-containing protein [Bacillota bacterium]